jgi:hypothetical protein
MQNNPTNSSERNDGPEGMSAEDRASLHHMVEHIVEGAASNLKAPQEITLPVTTRISDALISVISSSQGSGNQDWLLSHLGRIVYESVEREMNNDANNAHDSVPPLDDRETRRELENPFAHLQRAKVRNRTEELSSRERCVLGLQEAGYPPDLIARGLGITMVDVEVHTARALRKIAKLYSERV